MIMSWRPTVWLMRFLCPAALLAAAVLGFAAWSCDRYDLVVIDAFFAGVNATLTTIQWFWFKP